MNLQVGFRVVMLHGRVHKVSPVKLSWVKCSMIQNSFSRRRWAQAIREGILEAIYPVKRTHSQSSMSLPIFLYVKYFGYSRK